MASSASRDTKQKIVLIVEDELPIQKALVFKLEKFDIEVFTANNGEEGLLTAFLEHPNLIVLDIVMPIMNGIEFLKALRNDDWGKDIKVVALTNSTSNIDVSDLIKYGVRDYYVKADWPIDDIIKMIRNLLER